MYHTGEWITPAVGPWAPIEVVVKTPLEKHDYREERDFVTGFWVLACYTCNRYFGLRGLDEKPEHIKYYEDSLRKYEFMAKRAQKIADGRGQK